MKKIRIIYILLLWAIAIPAVAQQRSRLKDEASARLVSAMAAYNSGRYAEAYKQLADIIDLDPTNDAALYYMGLSAYAKGDVAEAEVHLKEALKLDPKNYWYNDMLARLYSSTNREELTISIYENLLKDHPKKLDIYYNLANLYGKTGSLDKMLSTFDDIETVSGKNEQVTLARYDVLMQLKKPDEAFKTLERYADDFASARVLTAMGDHKMQMYDDSLALRYYDEALSYEYDYAPALLGSSEIYRQRRQYDKYFKVTSVFMASEMVEPSMKSKYLSSVMQHSDPQFVRNFQIQIDSLVNTGLACHQKDSTMLSMAGSYYYATGREDTSAALLQRNVKANPECFSARADLVQALSYMGRWNELLDAAEEASAAFPQEPGFINMKSVAHYNLGDYMGVIKDNERLLATFPKDSAVVLSAYSTIGDMQHELGNAKQAHKAYDKALKVNADYAPVLNNYAYFISIDGKHLSKAYKMSQKTVKLEPDNATYLDTYAWILHMQGKDTEAKPFFKHAMIYGGKESATILDHYAEVLYALGEYDLATVYWELAKGKNADHKVPDLEERVAKRLEAIKK
ncbi:MAG: tetratricopeptide repeat protein [Bacteroidales bacterium]|nr:tetratricopeptide repeat protein [Bacteroidales bacterium]